MSSFSWKISFRKSRVIGLVFTSVFLVLFLYLKFQLISSSPTNKLWEGAASAITVDAFTASETDAFLRLSEESEKKDDRKRRKVFEVTRKRRRSLFPQNFLSQEVLSKAQSLKQVTHFDPRLLPSLYISAINREIASKKKLPEDFKLPFNWNMLTNSLSKVQENSLYDTIIKGGANCSTLRAKVPYSDKNLECQMFLENDENNRYGLSFQISGNMLKHFDERDMRKLYGNLHCLTGFSIPEKLIFLGAFENSKSLIVPTEKFIDGKQDLKNNIIDKSTLGISVLAKEFIGNTSNRKDINSVLQEGVLGYDELAFFNKLTNKYAVSETFILSEDLLPDPSEPLQLDHSLFEWNVKEELDKLADGNVFKPYLDQAIDIKSDEKRYFGEAYLKDNIYESCHFDWRFFDGYTQSSPDFHQATIHRMLRSWFKFSNNAGVYSWLSHGSLIGFYWNGYSLPYDNDIDIQVPIQSLYKLAQKANNSIVFDMTNDNYVNNDFKIDRAAEIGYRSYYLDVNPFFGVRSKLKGNSNVIDARFIDVRTGLFIDITALASLSSYSNKEMLIQGEILKTFEDSDRVRFIENLKYDQFYDGIIPKNDIYDLDREKFRKRKKEKGKKLFEVVKSKFLDDLSSGRSSTLFDNLVNCKNNHFYNLEEFLPLIPTHFENTLTFIPSSWFKLLVVEYDPNSIQWFFVYGYVYLPNMNIWVKESDCDPRSPNLNKIKEKCLAENEYLRNEYNRAQPYYRSHRSLLNLILPFDDLKNITSIDETFAVKHFSQSRFREISLEFDNHLLRPEPWISQNLF